MPDHVVTRSVLVPASPDEAWDALVELEEWFADDVDADELVVDAEVTFTWEDGERRDAIVEEVDAPKRLAFRWRDTEGQESHVAFDLDEDEIGTRVTVVESGLTDRAAARRAASWGPTLMALSAAPRAVLA